MVATSSTAVRIPPRAATAGWRRAQRAYRSRALVRRARIGSSSRNRRRSSAIASAVGVAVARVLVDRLQDDRLQVARDPRVDRPRPRRLVALDLLDQRQRGRASRRPAGASAARRGSGPASRRRPGRRPGRGTARAPCSGACPGCRRSGSGSSSSALARPKSVIQTTPVGVEQQVRRLDVAVEDAAGVRRGPGPRPPAGRSGPRSAVIRPGAATRPPRAGPRPAAPPRCPGRP